MVQQFRDVEMLWCLFPPAIRIQMPVEHSKTKCQCRLVGWDPKVHLLKAAAFHYIPLFSKLNWIMPCTEAVVHSNLCKESHVYMYVRVCDKIVCVRQNYVQWLAYLVRKRSTASRMRKMARARSLVHTCVYMYVSKIHVRERVRNGSKNVTSFRILGVRDI